MRSFRRPFSKKLGHHLLGVEAEVEIAEARNTIRSSGIPIVLGRPHKIPDSRIGRPGATKRRMPQGRWYAGLHEWRDVGSGSNRFDRWQATYIERGCRRCYLFGPWHALVRLLRFCRLADSSGVHLCRLLRFGGGLALAARPTAEKIIRIVHLRSSPVDGPRRASASGFARSRLRFTNARSTWCCATKAATASCSGSGIGRGSTMLAPASVIPSPSAGSAVTAATS